MISQPVAFASIARYEPIAPRVNAGLVAKSAVFVLFAAIIVVEALFPSNASAADSAKTHVILAFGTSLTQGYNLPPGTEFTAVLAKRLNAKGHRVRIVNAGVSGDTSAGGLARLDWAFSEPVDSAIIELGSNDALRGLKPSETEANLDAIIVKLKARKIKMLLTGIMAPRNLGPDYGREFDAIYPRLAKKHGVAFYPFFLDGVAAQLPLNQADGIHPNEKGTSIIVGRMLPFVEKLIAP
jgi:acyl-CoA thioesterase-1